MKTKLILLCAFTLLIAGCEKNSECTSATTTQSMEMKNGHMLRTDFPPEAMEGTPEPIRFSGIVPMTVPLHEAQGPGTSGVFYQDLTIESSPVARQ